MQQCLKSNRINRLLLISIILHYYISNSKHHFLIRLKHLFFILLFTIPFQGSAQSNLDSLWSEWENESNADSIQLKALYTYIWDGYLFDKPDTALHLIELMHDDAVKSKIPKLIANSINSFGVAHYFLGEFDIALGYFNECLELNKELNDQEGIGFSLNNIALVFQDQGSYDLAIQNYTKALQAAERANDKRGAAGCLSNIGLLFKKQDNLTEAIDYFERAHEINQEIGDELRIAIVHTNLGTCYLSQDNYPKALHYFNLAIEVEKKQNQVYRLATSYVNLGLVHQKKEEYTKALEYYLLAENMEIQVKDVVAAAKSKIRIATIKFNLGSLKEAIPIAENGLATLENLGVKEGIQFGTQTLWELYREAGNYKKSLDMHERYVSITDSLTSSKFKEELSRQKYKYAYEKKAEADSLVNIERNKVTQATIVASEAENKQRKQLNYFLYGVSGLFLIFGLFILSRFRITSRQKQIIEKQKDQVDLAFDQLEEKNTEIMDSIKYAKRIQSAILPTNKAISEHLKDVFVLYTPKDVVAGDFYWLESTEQGIYFAAADCTGHGVPGAMVSVICNNSLNQSVREFGLTEPGEILDKTRQLVIKEFDKSEEDVKDGMDIALCKLSGEILSYAGANNPLWIVRDGELLETKADKQPIGKFERSKPFKTHTIKLIKGDTIYIFSDGFSDQFGGEKGKKFKSNNFKKLLLSIQDRTMIEQHKLLAQHFENWRGKLEQIDDVCVIGLRV